MKKTVATAVVAGTLFISPLTGEAAAGDRILFKGTVHEDVKALQTELTELTSFNLASDGIFGPLTKKAVTGFQQRNSLQVDGIAGPETAAALEAKRAGASLASRTASDPAWDGTHILAEDSRGAAVESLQSYLNEEGFNTGGIDGIFGPLTDAAVRDFQSQAGIQVDGLAGPETFGALTEDVSEAENTGSGSDSTGQTGSGESSGASDKETSASGEEGTDSGGPSGESSSSPGSSAGSESAGADALISDAKNLLGSSYVWGGTTPDGFDSSGFITYVFRQNGIKLSRTHREYWHEGESVSSPRRGDVVFFETYREGPSHAGIYLGNNEFIHNSSSQGVIITSMDNPYWSPKYIGAKRYF